MFEISIAVFVYVCIMCFCMGVMLFFIILSISNLRNMREIKREAEMKRLEYLILKYINEDEKKEDK